MVTKQSSRKPDISIRSHSRRSVRSLSEVSNQSKKWRQKEGKFHKNILMQVVKDDKLLSNKYVKNAIRIDPAMGTY